MRIRSIALVTNITLFLFSGFHAAAQVLSTSSATAVVVKDPQAIAFVQTAMSTLSNVAQGVSTPSSAQDSVASGTLVLDLADGPLAMPITLKTKGTRMIRVELQKPKGTTVRIVNNGVGVLEQPDGTVLKLLMNNTIVERVNHIPAFSLLAEIQDPSVSIESLGAASVNGNATYVVAIRPLPVPNIPQSTWEQSTPRTSFFIDAGTGLISKIAYKDFAENDPNSTARTVPQS